MAVLQDAVLTSTATEMLDSAETTEGVTAGVSAGQ